MTFPLRDIPAALWTKAKIRALKDGLTMQMVMLKLVAEYVAHGLRKD